MRQQRSNPSVGSRQKKRTQLRSRVRAKRKIKADSRSPGRKRAEVSSELFDQADRLTLNAARRVKGRKLYLRVSFIESQGDGPSPLAQFLRGGRGGSVRLRLYLAILWIAANPPYDTDFPARAWAELLGLPDPAGRGTRRVREAISWLETRGFIRVERAVGRPAKIFLRREDGTGRPYVVPPQAPKDKDTGKLGPEDWWVALPATFWTNRWARSLSPAAIALLLVILLLTRESKRWINPEEARQRFALSEDTWTKGTKELSGLGLIRIGREPISEEFGWQRLRNTYSLQLECLEK